VHANLVSLRVDGAQFVCLAEVLDPEEELPGPGWMTGLLLVHAERYIDTAETGDMCVLFPKRRAEERFIERPGGRESRSLDVDRHVV